MLQNNRGDYIIGFHTHPKSQIKSCPSKSDKEFIYFQGRRISLKLKEPLEGETEKIFKGEIIDWDDKTGLKFFRFDDGIELQIPKSNIQSAKLYID